MILVDSSCWVEYYRASGDQRAQAAVAAAIEADQAAICGLVKVEILPFVRDAEQFRVVLEDFSSFNWLTTGEAEYNIAVHLGRALRARGVTVPASELVIAATAIGHQAVLLHVDRHYEQIATVSDLVQSNPTLGSGEPRPSTPWK